MSRKGKKFWNHLLKRRNTPLNLKCSYNIATTIMHMKRNVPALPPPKNLALFGSNPLNIFWGSAFYATFYAVDEKSKNHHSLAVGNSRFTLKRHVLHKPQEWNWLLQNYQWRLPRSLEENCITHPKWIYYWMIGCAGTCQEQIWGNSRYLWQINWGDGESQKYAHPPTWKTSLPKKPLHPSDHKRGLLLHVMSVKIYRPVFPYVSIYLHTDCAIPHW